MELTALEADFLGDLAQDDHALYEVFHFVRAHYPGVDDHEVLRIGRDLVSTWLQRGWLGVAEHESSTVAPGVADLLAIIDAEGIGGTYQFSGAPWLRLTPRACEDVEWLRAVG